MHLDDLRHMNLYLPCTWRRRIMKRILGLSILLFLLFSTTSFGEEVTPFVDQAYIDVTAGEENVVVQEITLKNLDGFENGEVEHILTKLGNVENLTFISGGENLEYQMSEEEALNRVY